MNKGNGIYQAGELPGVLRSHLETNLKKGRRLMRKIDWNKTAWRCRELFFIAGMIALVILYFHAFQLFWDDVQFYLRKDYR